MDPMNDATRVIDLYCEAWTDPDERRRAELLAAAWSSTATYTDPRVHASGPAELLAHIAKLHATRPPFKVERTSEVDQHHRFARFRWRAVQLHDPTRIEAEGLDLVVFDPDGAKMEIVVGFLGEPAPRTDR